MPSRRYQKRLATFLRGVFLPKRLVGAWIISSDCSRLGASSCESSSHPGCWVARHALWALGDPGAFQGGVCTVSSHSRTEQPCSITGRSPCWAVPGENLTRPVQRTEASVCSVSRVEAGEVPAQPGALSASHSPALTLLPPHKRPTLFFPRGP